MRALVLYPCPMQLDGISIQGEMLHRGLNELGHQSIACDRDASFQKKWHYMNDKPQLAIGVGYWGDTPNIVLHPQKYGIQPVPWLNADGWVSNYMDVLDELPLMFTTSRWVKETYYRDGLSNKNIFPQPIGIDTNEMSPLPRDDPGVQSVRKMLGVKEDEKMILTIGGDTTSKGCQEVLRALAKIDKEFSDWKYVGKSWYCPYYHRRDEMDIIRESGLSNSKIKFIDGSNSRHFVRTLLGACDIYAAPSRIEGFGMLQVEAQSVGKPVISIDAMGIKDTVVHGKTGFLANVGEEVQLDEEWVYRKDGFPKKMKIKFDKPKTFAFRADVDDLADHMLRLLSDDDLREKMGQDGRKHVVDNFHYTVTSKKMADIIKDKLGIE